MKTKASIAALAALAATAGSAYSQTVIDITGSTAGRSAVHSQILALLSNETFAYSGSGASSATRAIYKGTFNNEQVIIRTYWSGSAAGVRDISNAPQLHNLYFATSTDTSAGTTANGVAIATPVLAPASPETVSEIGFSDVFQTSTAFTTNTLVQQDPVGVIPFKFFKNDGAPAALTNITPGQFRTLYTSTGDGPLSLFTGNAAHTSRVYVTGRDEFSGTRITALAETGAGVFSTLSQFMGSVVDDQITPTFAGNNGYSSGSGVAGLLAAKFDGGAFIGYLGASDWNAATTGGATEIAFNGVTLGANSALIHNGAYSFWGYLHQSSMNLTGVTATFYTALKTNLLAAPGTGLILISDMNVERAADGAPITPL